MRRECSSLAALLSIFSGKSFIDFCLEGCFLRRPSIDFCLESCLLRGSLTDVCLESCLIMPLPSIGVEGWGDRGSTSNCEDRCRSRWSRRTSLWPLSAAVSEIMFVSSPARFSSSSIASNSSSSSPKAMQTQVRRDALTPIRSHYVDVNVCV